MWFRYRPYVPVAQRKAQAAREVAKRRKGGDEVSPVVIVGRDIAKTFWGEAWCDNLESYSDYENRLPRGRSYVRNGSVVDLQIEPGKIKALVSGSELYKVAIDIKPLPGETWRRIKAKCAGKVGSAVDLLRGKLSDGVAAVVTERGEGLFPKPAEIAMSCSCPDWAGMCKHVAAVMYGVGSRLDTKPELLFKLRQVDHLELVEEAVAGVGKPAATKAKTLDAADVAGVFGIDIAPPADAAPKKPAAKKKAAPKKPAAAKEPPAKKAEPKPRKKKGE